MDLGTDLRRGPDGDALRTPTGDVALSSGPANVAQAASWRAVRDPGALVWQPLYGGGLGARIEGPDTPATRQLAAQLIRRDLLRDPRVAEARVTVRREGGALIFDLQITTATGEAAASQGSL